MNTPYLLVLLLLAATMANADVVMARPFHHMDTIIATTASSSLALYPRPRYVTQAQDHFDANNTNTWQQAYYVNDTYFVRGSDAPVFLCVGGEGPPLDGSVVVSSVHCNVAVEWLQEKSALMIAVEHRYYGCHNSSACPYSRGDKHPLQYLSSHQAVEDLATAHAHVVAEYGLTKANKWISWGGSYPGMMASFFRIKHPELVHGSVASSAPVIASVEMQQYNDIVAAAYSLTSVGGSDACEAAIRDGHAKIGTMMKTSAGRNKLASLFAVAPSMLALRAGQRQFAGEGVANFPAQSNDPTCMEPACNIAKICAIMAADDGTGAADPVSRLAALRKAQRGGKNKKALRGEVQTTGEDDDVAPLDYWGYQTCTEFGFYQTCDVGSKCFYTQGLDVLADEEGFCQTDFGISLETVAANVKATNDAYGADHPKATRIMYPNGDVDPWHGLSKLTAGPELPVLMVSGASHHAWTHPSSPEDSEAITEARLAIKKQVTAWLSED